MKNLNDTLIQGIKNGDSSVIESVMEEYRKKVFSLAQSMVNNRDNAFEITCKAFSLIFRSTEKFYDTDSFEKQLFSVCRTLCRETSIRAENTDTPSLRALYSLPVKYRSILILNDIYSFTLQQTAQLWDISERKAWHILYKGRKLIGKFINNQIS